MRDAAPNIMLRRQNVERKALAPVVGMVAHDEQAEPGFSERLCKAIVAYWRAQNVEVRAWVEYQRNGQSNTPDGRSLYVIRSIGIPGARA